MQLIIKVILLNFVLFLFTACGPIYRVQSINLADNSSSELYMVANYDSVCTNSGSKADFIIKKGDLLRAVDIFSEKQVFSMTEGTVLNVPKHVIHLHAYTNETWLLNHTWFFQVYPNGTFSTVGSTMLNCLEESSSRRNCVYIEGSCILKDGKPLFKEYEGSKE